MSTVKEHYIPRCILRNFTDELGNVTVLDKFDKSHFAAKPSDVFARRNLYETKNVDGTFYHRNEIEELLSQMETNTARAIKHFDDIYNSGLKDLTVEDYFVISEHLAAQLLRGPDMQEIIQTTEFPVKDTQMRSAYEQAMKRELFVPNHDGYSYLKQNGFQQDGQDARRDWSIMQKISCFLHLYFSGILFFATNNRTFWIGDSPTLINPFPNIQYAIPLSQNYVFLWRRKQSFMEEAIVCEHASMAAIDIINRQMFEKARRHIAFNKIEFARIMDLCS